MIQRKIVTALAVASLAGCAAHPVAIQDDFNAFLYKLQAVCPFATVGASQMQNLVNNATFIDLTSRLYYGRITRDQYALGVSTNFLGANDAPAIQCVFDNFPAARPAAGGQGYQPLVDPTPPVVTPTR
jgi:hypothetical protein